MRYPESVRKNIRHIPEFGRFDDLYALIGTPLEDDMWRFMGQQLDLDVMNEQAGNPVSLLAKWVKTPDVSSKRSSALGKLTAEKLGYTPYKFKRVIRRLRKHLDVVERKMSNNSWGDISYQAVPSNAMLKHSNAFYRHDYSRYSEYLQDVREGRKKINTGTLYPYDIVEKVLYSHDGDDDALQVMWDNLPDYVQGGVNAMVVADTSGSMMGRPMATSIGLAMYFAQHNTGAYHGMFMSFSKDSNIHVLRGSTLREQIANVEKTEWMMNTNLEAAFDKVLGIAVENGLPAEELPKALIIVSDMEIDGCLADGNRSWSFYDAMEKKYAAFGYELPNIVFWNVASRNNVFHADANKRGVLLVSGSSASTFANVLASLNMTPEEAMYAVLDVPRYSVISA